MPTGADVDTSGWDTTPDSTDPHDVMGNCTGNWIEGVIVDTVVVPENLSPGEYVLGFRFGPCLSLVCKK